MEIGGHIPYLLRELCSVPLGASDPESVSALSEMAPEFPPTSSKPPWQVLRDKEERVALLESIGALRIHDDDSLFVLKG